MVKRYVRGDEWYPVYELREPVEDGEDHGWGDLEFTEDEVAEITDLFTKFAAWQDKLEDRLRASRDAWEAANPEENERRRRGGY